MKTRKKKLIIGITAPQSIILMHGQLKYFSSIGYDVFLLACPTEKVTKFCEEENATLLPIKIEREIKPLKDLVTLFAIWRIFRKVKPDIINLGTPKISLLGMTAAKLLGVGHRIYTCRGFRFEHEKGFLRKVLLLMEKFTVSQAHKVVCISPSVLELGISEKIFSKEQTTIIHKGSSNGIDLNLFNPDIIKSDEKNKLKKEFDIKEDDLIIGYVGRIIERKGINELFDAFQKIHKKNQKTKLLIVGRPYFDQLTNPNIIPEMDNHPGVILAGLQPIDQIPLFLSSFDIFVLPAYWEGFGNVLVQAAAMGLPVISTEATGTRDAVKKDFNGILVKPKSSDELFKAMELLIENKPLRTQMGQNGISWAKNFENKLIWEGLNNLYQNGI